MARGSRVALAWTSARVVATPMRNARKVAGKSPVLASGRLERWKITVPANMIAPVFVRAASIKSELGSVGQNFSASTLRFRWGLSVAACGEVWGCCGRRDRKRVVAEGAAGDLC